MRLSTTIIPEHYYFTIKVYLPGYGAIIEKDKEFTFEATVRIKLYSQIETDTIILNEYGLQYLQENCYVKTEGNRRIKIKSIISKNQKVAFVFESKIEIGFAELVIDYNGKAATEYDLHGLYPTTYKLTNGTTKYGIITELEMNHARKIVPCFDEPEFKAKWTMEIIHPKGTTALSNQIEIGNPEEMGDFLVTKFKTTVPMSSYIMAISINDFKFIEGFARTGIRMRVWLQSDLIQNAKFALKAGLKCLEKMEKLFGIPYPMDKIDMVGVSPFLNGGMENYGLITYQDYAMIYKEGEGGYEQKEANAALIAHELAHMWFGDLVTPKWWDNVWLNEAFASYMEMVGKDMISDGLWDTENTFLLTHQGTAFNRDDGMTSLPLRQRNDSNWEVFEEQFGYIYEKGASVLAMIRHLIGGDRFDKAVRRYLNIHSYGNVDHNDLLNELTKEIPHNLKGPRNEEPVDIYQFAKRWLEQPGYPILNVQEINETTVRVTQSHVSGYKWDVPVWVQEKNHKLLTWLPFDKDLIIRQHSSNALVLNYDSYAYAKVNYTAKGWNKILKQLEEDHTVFSERTKYRIILDFYKLARKSQKEIIEALAPYLVQEKDFLPWLAVKTNFVPWNDTVLPQFLMDALHKEPVFIKDDASYVKNRVKDQQRGIYCKILNCRHRAYIPASSLAFESV